MPRWRNRLGRVAIDVDALRNAIALPERQPGPAAPLWERVDAILDDIEFRWRLASSRAGLERGSYPTRDQLGYHRDDLWGLQPLPAEVAPDAFILDRATKIFVLNGRRLRILKLMTIAAERSGVTLGE